MDTYTILKAVVVIYIITVTFTDINRRIRVPFKKTIDIILLGTSIGIMLVDFHLGILMTIAVMIYILQTNHAVIEEAQDNIQQNWQDFRVERFQTKGLPIHQETSACVPIADYGNEKKQEASKDILSYTLDDKVKPYEIYVKMLSTQEHLDSAANSAFLGTFAEDSML